MTFFDITGGWLAVRVVMFFGPSELRVRVPVTAADIFERAVTASAIWPYLHTCR